MWEGVVLGNCQRFCRRVASEADSNRIDSLAAENDHDDGVVISHTITLTAMSRNNTGGWLKGTTVRKGGITGANAHSTRSNTPQVQSTSTTIFGGGVKDASGRTSEYFVSSTRVRVPFFSQTSICVSPWTINAPYASPTDI